MEAAERSLGVSQVAASCSGIHRIAALGAGPKAAAAGVVEEEVRNIVGVREGRRDRSLWGCMRT